MKKFYLLIPVIIIFFSSCKNNPSERNFFSNTNVKPSSSGRPGEIIVVSSNKIWNSSVGDTVFYTLSAPFYGLPQDEPSFKISHLPPQNTQSTYKIGRNLIFINISDTAKNSINVERNKWANEQLIFYISATDTNSFLKLWKKNYEKIFFLLFNNELRRYQEAFKKAKNKDLSEILAKYGVAMTFPEDYKLIEKKKNFIWISRETLKSTQAFFIHIYPFLGGTQLSTDSIISKWNYIFYKNVPGPREGTYPAVEDRYPIEVTQINVNGKGAIFMRGLWKTEGGYFLGGPFLCLTTVDENTGNVISIFALIYGGKEDKKLLVWQAEAIIKSLKIL